MKDFNWALVISALLLGLSVVAGGWMIGASIESTAGRIVASLDALRSAVGAAPSQLARNAPPARPARPDPNRRYEVSTEGAPVSSPSKRKIDIVAFSDFQCPFCKRVGPTIERIEEEYGNDVRVVFKHLPLSIHPQAQGAHAAAEAAHKQGRFWEMHDLIFENQRQLNEKQYLAYAKQIGLDVDRFQTDMKSAEVRRRIEADTAEASKLGVTGTPAFFINGRFLSGAQPYESFKRLIDEELEQVG